MRGKRRITAPARRWVRAPTGPRAPVLAVLAALALALPTVASAEKPVPRDQTGRPLPPAAKQQRVKPTLRDLDGDRIRNERDGDVDGDGVKNRFDPDVDGDRLPNGRDRNLDGDQWRNSRDRDLDGDRRLNVADDDSDGDRARNDYDHDIDADGVENAWDVDSDSSGDPPLVAADAGAPVDPGFVGMISDDAFWGTDADPTRSRTMTAVAATGAHVLRQAFSWSIIEPRPGKYDFELYDEYVEAAGQEGLTLLPILFDPPAFRSSRPAAGATRGIYPPASNADFAAFAAALVRRYGPDGEFWRTHEQLPELPIRTWQIWNEPNIPYYWPSGPDPGAYARMLKAVAPAIKAHDAGARVVTAGLNESELGIKLVPFLRGMYAAGARNTFDVLGVHPYAPASDLVVDQLRRAAHEMRRNGDDAHILVTELGWASGGPSRRALVVGEKGQAALIRSTLQRLAQLRGKLRLDGVFYFNWRDVAPPAGAGDHWGRHTGLLREDGSAKPALAALSETVRAITAP
jgi:polysaccharide biosynthesis protein PslG